MHKGKGKGNLSLPLPASLPSLYPANLRAANKQNCHLSQAPQGRAGRARDEGAGTPPGRWSDNFLCSLGVANVFILFYFYTYIFIICLLSEWRRGWGREVCLSAIFPLILSRFVACFIQFFFYFLPCLLAGVYVCVCVRLRQVAICKSNKGRVPAQYKRRRDKSWAWKKKKEGREDKTGSHADSSRKEAELAMAYSHQYGFHVLLQGTQNTEARQEETEERERERGKGYAALGLKKALI